MRCFNEIPAGSFICTYEGEIMTSDECEERAKQPGMTDRYFYDLEISSVRRPLPTLADPLPSLRSVHALRTVWARCMPPALWLLCLAGRCARDVVTTLTHSALYALALTHCMAILVTW
jgi:hypothetical protein